MCSARVSCGTSVRISTGSSLPGVVNRLHQRADGHRCALHRAAPRQESRGDSQAVRPRGTAHHHPSDFPGWHR
jgi:hypothetical protein